jgi:outer membrane receptor protein involved in Fe transport
MRSWVFSFVLAVIFVCGGSAFGQTETGMISGTVTDQGGGVVPKAQVTVRNLGTGLQRVTETDAHGYYSVPNLLPAVYSVTVEAQNFARREERAEVTVGSRVELNFTLSVGATSTTIEVVGEGGVQVNTETQTIGTVIDSQKISELPTLTRNPYDFAANVGTASNGDPSARGVGVAFNGLRSAGTNILLDGAANNDEFVAAVGQTVPLDSVQEFSVLTNNFTAEYGRASAGVVNVTTKSGSNDFHGSAYEYNRVSALASEGFYDKANGNPKESFVRNQFGYSLGGPIKKNKLFFFNNTEWIRIRSAANETNYVLDPAFVSNAASNLQSYFNSYGKLRSNATQRGVVTVGDLQTAGLCTTGACAALAPSTPAFDLVNYTVPADAGAGAPENAYETVGNVDYTISNKTSAFVRYALYRETDFAGVVSSSPYAGFDTGQTTTDNRAVVSLVHSFSPRLTDQSKLVFNRLNNLQPLGTNPAIPGLYFSNTTTTSVPAVGGLGSAAAALPGYLPFTPGNGIPFGGPQNFVQAYEDWSLLMGRHTLRFGGSYDYQRDNRTFGAYETPVGAFSSAGALSNAALNNLLAGQWASFQGAIDPQGKYPCGATPNPTCEVNLPVTFPVFARSNRYQEFAVYGQDGWKLSNHFTFNLGLRWEYFGVQHNKNPYLDSNFYLASGGSIFSDIRNGGVDIAPESQLGGLWKPDYNNFGPRVGFAWDLFGNGKTSLRGGYGISYERNFGNVTFNVIQNPPNYAVISLITGVDVASDPVTVDPAGPLSGTSGTKALPKVSLRAVNPNIRTAYAHLYSLTLEREIKRNMVVGIDYSGSKGEHLYDISNINQPGAGNVYFGDTAAFSRLVTTQYTNINFRNDEASSLYNALVARISLKNFANTGLTLDSNYTWSHTWDDLSDTFSSSGNQYNLGYLDPFRPKVDWGNSYLDIRQRFVVQAIWDVPLARNSHGWVKQVANGWEVAPIFTAQTGSPYSIYDCTNAIAECMYAVPAAGSQLPRTGKAINTSAPDTYLYAPFYTNLNPDGTLSATSAPLFDSSYVNPIAGVSDFGPWPSNMLPRNYFRGPGRWNINLGLYKTFALTERAKLQFRTEMYNAFNHANLFVNAGNADVAEFTEFGAYKDGLRNIQMALRLTF